MDFSRKGWRHVSGGWRTGAKFVRKGRFTWKYKYKYKCKNKYIYKYNYKYKYKYQIYKYEGGM